MIGSIRAGLGFLLVYGAVGSLDSDPTSSILLGISVGVLGLALMSSGIRAMNLRG